MTLCDTSLGVAKNLKRTQWKFSLILDKLNQALDNPTQELHFWAWLNVYVAVNLFLRSICFQPQPMCFNLGQFASTYNAGQCVSTSRPICFNPVQYLFQPRPMRFNLGQFVLTQVNLNKINLHIVRAEVHEL